MVKCLECGKEKQRLTWRHFTYNCTGKFKNGTEYMKFYEGASIVDPEVAKKTAITEENFIKKYGEIEGIKRFSEYKEKQAYSNSFEYKNDKHGWTEDEYTSFNKSRAVTKENLIKKHGEDKGLEKWNNYTERQRYTNSIEYFIEKYGKEEGTIKWNIYRDVRSKNFKIGSVTQALEEDFVDQLIDELGFDLDYSYQNTQYCEFDNKNKAHFYDIVHDDKVIEINGDYWHCNPALYESSFYHSKLKMSAKEKWNLDRKKINLISKNGYKVLIIWEKDIRTDMKGVLEKCKQFILS